MSLYSFQATSALLVFILFSTCSMHNTDMPTSPEGNGDLYFPPVHSSEWLTIDEGWEADELEDIKNFMEANNTRAFIILKDGKIALEEYFGKNILNTTNFNRNTNWYWASAGKTLSSALIGIAQHEGDLDITQSSSTYLGEGWTSLEPAKEQLITIQHQLTMTSGLDYRVSDLNCTQAECFQYKTDAGEQWYYHNAVYTLLSDVVEAATGINYNTYTDQKIGSIIGMEGKWMTQGSNKVYWSNARSMARFGLLMLNKGTWENTDILEDKTYYRNMVNTSQDLNPSYGYLWWLNGKSSIITPYSPQSLDQSFNPAAPSDMISGVGTNGQYLDIVPSHNLVVIRLGDAPLETDLTFHHDMWEKLSRLIN